MQTLQVTIQGMSCGHCVAAVRKELALLPGVRVEDVRIGSASVRFDPLLASPAQIEAAVGKAGFRVSR